MSSESDYIDAESRNIAKTVGMIAELFGKEKLDRYETIALGKLLQDVYSGIERILRARLESRGIRIRKTESWHKDLLTTAKKSNLVSQRQFEVFRDLLLFRHLQIHGYGYMLNENRLKSLAGPVPQIVDDFLRSPE